MLICVKVAKFSPTDTHEMTINPHSLKHVPGFIQRAEEIMDRQVKEIICITGLPGSSPSRRVCIQCINRLAYTSRQ